MVGKREREREREEGRKGKRVGRGYFWEEGRIDG